MGRASARAGSKLVREVVEGLTKGVGRVDGSEVLRSGAGSRGGSRFGAGASEVGARGRDLSRVDRGDGRDPRGRFTGKGNYGKDKEKLGLDKVSEEVGAPVVRKQVRISVRGLSIIDTMTD